MNGALGVIALLALLTGNSRRRLFLSRVCALTRKSFVS